MRNFFNKIIGKSALLSKVEEERLAALRYRAILDATATYVWIADAKGILTKSSQNAWRDIFGNEVHHILDRVVAIHPEDKARVSSIWKESLDRNIPWDTEYRLNQHGEYVYYQGRGVPVFDKSQTPIEWIGVSINIDAQKKWEFALQEAKNVAETANQAKTDFLAMMSHELRTPLTAIMGYSEIMAMGIHGPVNQEMEQDFNRILRSSNHLLNLIGGILDFTKLENGKLRLKNTAINIKPLVESSYDIVKPLLEEKHHEFYFENNCEARARADGERVQQILVNLLSNAIKFTPRGGKIKIKCYTQDKQIVTEVIDNGIGMAPSDVDTIFEPFVQLDSGMSRSYGGTGLGLAISHQLVKSMGGDIKVSSVIGEGSVFQIYLPMVMKLD